MSFSLNNSSILQRTVELNYANQKRATSLKWSVVNGVFFLLFAYDLSCKCPGHTTLLHYVEFVLVGVLGANLLQHVWCMLPRRFDPITLTQTQQKLLGLSDNDLDRSFRVLECSTASSRADTSATAPEALSRSALSEAAAASLSELSMSLSPARAWRPAASPPSPATPSPPRSRSNSPRDDEFIADRRHLDDYLQQYERRRQLASPAGATTMWGSSSLAPLSPHAPHYQLSVPDTDGGSLDESAGAGGAGAGAGAGAAAEGAGGAQLWRRLNLDPQRLTQFNLNLRLWLHLTIFSRLVREMAAADEALARLGSEVRVGQAPLQRLRAAAPAVPALARLLPFLEPFPDQRYAVQRIRELSQGGCLSAYRWNAGGAGWDGDEARPADAELVVALFGAYMDLALPPPAFTAAHVSNAPAAAPRGPGALALRRVARRPPHYVLEVGDATLEPPAGRANLLHALLLLVAAAAPALHRVHLGPAGLNMLWIIGR